MKLTAETAMATCDPHFARHAAGVSCDRAEGSRGQQTRIAAPASAPAHQSKIRGAQCAHLCSGLGCTGAGPRRIGEVCGGVAVFKGRRPVRVPPRAQHSPSSEGVFAGYAQRLVQVLQRPCHGVDGVSGPSCSGRGRSMYWAGQAGRAPHGAQERSRQPQGTSLVWG
jgi:hypothetical protein